MGDQQTAAGTLRGASMATWSLGSFHAAVLTLLLVLLGFRGGRLGDALGGLDTAVGLAIFALLWAISWWATARATRGLPSIDAALESGAAHIFWRAWAAGGLAGFVFLLSLAVLALLATALDDPGRIRGIDPDLMTLSVALAVLFYLPVASAFAYAIGGLIGVAFALLDRGLIALSYLALPAPERRSGD